MSSEPESVECDSVCSDIVLKTHTLLQKQPQSLVCGSVCSDGLLVAPLLAASGEVG